MINSKADLIKNIEKSTGKLPIFYQFDVINQEAVTSIFNNHTIDSVIHFASLKAVGESVEKPLAYYYNNLVSTMVLAEACIKHGVNKFVFSSPATVYGDNKVPFVETMGLLSRTNPYGETKAMCERTLTDIGKANPEFSVSLPRYFNPGALMRVV